MPVDNMDKLLTKLNNLERVLDMSEPLDEACILVENDAKRRCPVDTGQLRRSITHQVVGDIGYVGTNVEYAPYVEFGTGKFAAKGNGRQGSWIYEGPPHTVYPEPTHFAIGTRKDGTKYVYYTDELITPKPYTTNIWATSGQKPQPFLEPALVANKEMINRIFAIYLERELGE